VDFLHFQPSKIHVSRTGIVSSLSPPRCHLSPGRRRHATAPCHASSSGNVLSRRLPFRTETEALNPHHRHRLPSLDRLTPTLHCYKKIISTLATLPTIQLRLHFASSLAKAPLHQKSTYHYRSLSPLSHTHRPSTQQQP
jgi:hypothetical protein